MSEGKVLIINPDEVETSAMARALEGLGFEVESRPRLSSGLKAIGDDTAFVIVGGGCVDSARPDPLRALCEVKSYHPESVVILIAQNGDKPDEGGESPPLTFSSAVKEGAYCVLERPLDMEALRAASARAAAMTHQRRELKELRESSSGGRMPHLTGESRKIKKVMTAIEKAAGEDSHVMVTGEYGTGKELVANLIHMKSRRSKSHFSSIRLSSIPRDIAEAEVFKEASMASLKGGTLYINASSGLGQTVDRRLLGLLRSGKFVPSGGEGPVKANLRIIIGTSAKKPSGEVFDYLKGREIRLPPLRERREDIMPLARQFLSEAEREFSTGPKKFSKKAERFILSHEWPGNVTGLKATVKRAVIFSKGEIVEKTDLLNPDGLMGCSIKEFLEEKLMRFLGEMAALENSTLYDSVMSETEKSLIGLVLRETGGNQLKTSKALGMNRNTLRAKIKKYKIKGV